MSRLKIVNCDKSRLVGGLSRHELLTLANLFFTNIPDDATREQLCSELQSMKDSKKVEELAAELDRLRVRYTIRKRRRFIRRPTSATSAAPAVPVERKNLKRKRHDKILSDAGFDNSNLDSNATFPGFLLSTKTI